MESVLLTWRYRWHIAGLQVAFLSNGWVRISIELIGIIKWYTKSGPDLENLHFFKIGMDVTMDNFHF